MKRKHVITTFALSMFLGVGVFAGIHQAKVQEAKAADTRTIYCTCAQDWWKADGAAVSVHYWGGASAGTSWPGARMNQVQDLADTWKYEVPTDVTGLMFVRVNGSGSVSDWGAKTKDLTLQETDNLYTITSSSAVWGDPGVTGVWSTYVEPTPAVKYSVNVVVDDESRGVEQIEEGYLPADPTMAYGQVFSGWFDDAACTKGHEVTGITGDTTVYGKVTDAEKVTFALDTSKVSSVFTGTLNLYAWDNNGKNADWPGVEIADVNAIELPNTVKAIISKGNVQTNDINTLKDGDTLRIKNEKTTWESTDYYAFEWMSDVDEPAEEGYYLVGTESSWKYAGATKMVAPGTQNDDLAQIIGYEAKANEEFKVRSYLDGADTWYQWGQAEEGHENDNYAVGAEAKTLDIYLNDEGKFYVFDHVEPDPDVPAEEGYYIVGTESEWKYEGATKMDAGDDGDLAKLINYQAKANEEFKIRGYHGGVSTWYNLPGTEDNYKVGAEAKALDIFLNAYGTFFVFDHEEPDIPVEEGYYICGLDGWRYENATKMVAPSTVPGNVAHYMGLEAEVDDEIRVRSYYDDRTPKDQWAVCGNGEETYGEVSENNFKFTKAGTYDVYAYYIGDTFKYSVAEHVDSYTVEMTGVNFNGKAAAGTVALADQTAYSSANFEPELPIQNGYVARGVYEDEACATAYTPKVFDAAGHLYVKYTKIGVYMVGDDTFSGADLGWTVDGATILPAAINDTENNLYEGTITITGASVQNPVEVRPANYTFEGVLDYSMEYSLGVAYDFAKKVGNNIQFTENGTFAVYFNKSNQIYLNKGADAFYTKFLTEVGGICDPDGDTNLTNLASVWAAQEDAFNSLSKTERDAIKAVGFDGGDETGDDLHKVIAKYHYILTKYGTAVLNDFIFNQIDIEANVNTIGMTADDSVMTIVVIASISVISAAGLFFLIRRKRRLVK